jgi:hypothetical protein
MYVGGSGYVAIQKAKKELLAAEFIVQTKQGGFGTGPCLFAVTWYGIDDWSGLDLQRHEYRLGAWHIKTQNPQPSRIDSFESRIRANADFEPHTAIPISNIESAGGTISISPISDFENNVITITPANPKTFQSGARPMRGAGPNKTSIGVLS